MTVIEFAPTSLDSTVNQSAAWHIREFTYGVFVCWLWHLSLSHSLRLTVWENPGTKRAGHSNGHTWTNACTHIHMNTDTHRWGTEWLLFVWEKKAEAIRVHFSCSGLLSYLDWSRPILATVTGALGRLREGWGGTLCKPDQVADSAICSWEPRLSAAWKLTSIQKLWEKSPIATPEFITVVMPWIMLISK